MISLGPWLPDQASWGGKGARTATNVLPDTQGYIPFPRAVTFGNAASEPIRGALEARKDDGSFVFYAGTATKLLQFNPATGNWDDVSQAAYTLPPDDDWGFAQFGSLLIAVNQNTNPQFVNVETGGPFADLADSPPRARGVRVFADFVVLFDLVDDPRTVRWSDINNAESWTISSASLAGTQTFPDGGFVTAVTSADTGFVFQENTIRRMIFVPGSADVFHFERTVADMGLRSPYAYSERGEQVFFLSEDGFYRMSSQGIQNISSERVSKFFADDVLNDETWRVRGQADFAHPRIYWAYPSVNGGGDLDRILAYDWTLDRWTLVEQNVQTWLRGATAGTTLEQLDVLFPSGLETVDPSLDSRTWEGGAPVLGAFNEDNQLVFFTGSPKEATIDTPEVHLNPPHRARATWLRPSIDTSAAFFSIAARERLADVVSFGPEQQMTLSGRVPAFSPGRYHRFRVRIPEGTTWTHATSLDADFITEGQQ